MEWHILLMAAVTATSLHSIMEPKNIMDKLERLSEAIKTGKVRKPMIEGIDTRTKAYGIGIVMLAGLTLLGYFIANFFDPSVDFAIKYSIVVVLVAELILIAEIDKFHIDIEKVTQRLKKK